MKEELRLLGLKLRRRLMSKSLKNGGEILRRRKPERISNVGDGFLPGTKQLGRQFDPPTQKILMWRHTELISKAGLHSRRAQVRRTRHERSSVMFEIVLRHPAEQQEDNPMVKYGCAVDFFKCHSREGGNPEAAQAAKNKSKDEFPSAKK